MTKKQKILLEQYIFLKLIEQRKNKIIWSKFFKICKKHKLKPYQVFKAII
jgi:hypothetical protein